MIVFLTGGCTSLYIDSTVRRNQKRLLLDVIPKAEMMKLSACSEGWNASFVFRNRLTSFIRITVNFLIIYFLLAIAIVIHPIMAKTQVDFQGNPLPTYTIH